MTTAGIDTDTDVDRDEQVDEQVERSEEPAERSGPDEPDEPTDGSAEEEPRRDRRWLVLVVVAALLAGLGGFFLLRAHELRSAPSAANAALVDTGRTAEVSAAATSALNRIFSYAYDRTADTEQAAADLLRGEAKDTYDRLFAKVRELAPEQKLVLTTRVVSTAVQRLTGDSATVLVFLDQSAIRADHDASNAAAAQLSVTMSREGDRWVITELAPR